MKKQAEDRIQDHHRFIDEAGDMTFFTKKHGREISVIGDNGVSRCFMIGMVHVKEDLHDARRKVMDFCSRIDRNPAFQKYESVRKRTERGNNGFYPHASKDPNDLRLEYIEYLMSEINFSAQVVVARKIPDIYVNKHHRNNQTLYADVMSHLIKDKDKIDPLILDIAGRGNSTSNSNLEQAVRIAQKRSVRGKIPRVLDNQIRFNVQPFDHELLLSITDYCLWTVQRVYERGEDEYFEMLKSKISLVLDLYDSTKYDKNKNYYTRRNLLSATAVGFESWEKPLWNE